MEIQPTVGTGYDRQRSGGHRPPLEKKKQEPKKEKSEEKPASVYMPDGHVEENARPKIDLLV